MPPIDGFSIGTDQSLVITNMLTGSHVTLDGRRTSFESQANDKLLTSEPSDNGGLVEHRVIPGGWTGTIEADRKSADFSKLVAFLEAAFYANGPQVLFQIQSYEPNADKSAMNVFQYTRVVFHQFKPGTWAREKVQSRVEFACQQRISIS